MTEYQRLFLVQARSNFAVFNLLRKTADLPACHALHYLQMATELLAKAHAWRRGPLADTHREFVPFLQSLATNRRAQRLLGFAGHNESWRRTVGKGAEFAVEVEKLAPAIAGDGPNPEYPWPRSAPAAAPAEHNFDLWQELQDSGAGRKFLRWLEVLFQAAEQFI